MATGGEIPVAIHRGMLVISTRMKAAGGLVTSRLSRFAVRTAALLALAGICHAPAQAADLSMPVPSLTKPWAPPSVDPANRWEARFGVFAHGVGSVENGTVDLNGEFVSPRLFYATGTWGFLVPRIALGGMLNLSGRTDSAYATAVWTIPIYDRFFVEGFVGPAIHNGSLVATATQSGLGCHTLFNAGANIGYRIDDHWSVMATFNHMSNGKSVFGIDCGTNKAATGSNQGLNDYGIRVGYSF
jgi:opacity protein-like surface antigen